MIVYDSGLVVIVFFHDFDLGMTVDDCLCFCFAVALFFYDPAWDMIVD